MNEHIVPEEQLYQAIEVLRDRGVVAFPTDTLYGLGAWARSLKGIERVFSIKGRPQTMALPLLLAEPAQLEEVASWVPPSARRLAEAFWPGPLTLVVPRAAWVPALLTAGAPTVGVRVPDHAVPRELVRRLDDPITGTSANRSGTAPAQSAAEVRACLGDAVDLVIDGGATGSTTPSTLVDCSGDRPRLLRDGAVAREAIEATLGAGVLG